MIFPLPGVMGPMTLARPSASSPAFDPNSIAGLRAWFRADAGVTESSGLVSGWADQSPSGLDAAASGGQRPTLVAGAVNGLPALQFDGVGNYLDFPQQTLAGITTFAVQRTSGLSVILAGSTYSHQILRWNADGTKLQIWDGFSSWFSGPATRPRTSWTLLTVRATPWVSSYGTSAWWEDGASLGTSNYSDFDMRVGRIGATETPDGFASGLVAELLVYSGALADADRQSVESYLMTKYGL